MNSFFPATIAAGRHRVLVVESDDDTRSLYREAFRVADCDVVDAADGRDGLVKALTGAVSLVITGLRVPLLDGYALCEILRHDRQTAKVPILVVTTETRAAELQRAAHAGADAVLTKPVLPERIVQTAALLLKRSAGSGTPAPVTSPVPNAADDRAGTHSGRRTMSKAHVRFATGTPPADPPQLRCPLCDAWLTYERSQVGGVTRHNPEQWDYYVCTASCGTFQYRQRTRKIRYVE